MEIYCYILLALNGLALLLEKDVNALKTGIINVFIYLPIIGRILGWW